MMLKMLIPLSTTVIFMNFSNFAGVTSVIIYGLIYTILYIVTAYMIVMNKYEKNLVKSILIKLKK